MFCAITSPDIQQIISQAVSFLILLWLLRRFAWKPLLSILDERRVRIESEFAQSAERRAELDRMQEELNRRLTSIDEEARTRIQQAVLEGKRVAREVQEQGRSQAQAIITKSKETVALELAKAKVSLRDEMADIALRAAERILERKIDSNTDRELIEKVLDELEREGRHS